MTLLRAVHIINGGLLVADCWSRWRWVWVAAGVCELGCVSGWVAVNNGYRWIACVWKWDVAEEAVRGVGWVDVGLGVAVGSKSAGCGAPEAALSTRSLHSKLTHRDVI